MIEKINFFHLVIKKKAPPAMNSVFSATIAIFFFFFLSSSRLGTADKADKLLVLNRIGTGESLSVYCQSAVDHRSRHTIPDGGNASWGVLVLPREFFPSMCTGTWEDPRRSQFTLYNYHKDHKRCSSTDHGCTFKANAHGLYAWDEEKKHWELVQYWVKKIATNHGPSLYVGASCEDQQVKFQSRLMQMIRRGKESSHLSSKDEEPRSPKFGFPLFPLSLLLLENGKISVSLPFGGLSLLEIS
ncbi:hypothetical protein ACLOJK_015806 [Asimina triloba]